ncbi:HIT family protein [Pseudohongiella spirulinae]|uniref:HIT family hydrolase n=1 Tax=Pseudohongiella spirulinae TaxID=1249552 RepID=A0A0S2KGY6_9GAMM|nr:HIT family protein [Pseudohongiella spirulinae]ALO47596.1 HIT family hydrolase [Pseudohongiella spirulinae]
MSSLFTQIRLGQLPGHLLWDDGRCFAILTIKPINEGHLQLIPHEEVDHWDDMSPELTAHIFQVASTLSKTLRKLFPCEKTGLMIAGLEVRHAHLHLFPINAISDLDFSKAKDRADDAQKLTADKIRAALQEQGLTSVPAD